MMYVKSLPRAAFSYTIKRMLFHLFGDYATSIIRLLIWFLCPSDWEAVVKLSEDFNGADLRNVCTEAGELPT